MYRRFRYSIHHLIEESPTYIYDQSQHETFDIFQVANNLNSQLTSEIIVADYKSVQNQNNNIDEKYIEKYKIRPNNITSYVCFILSVSSKNKCIQIINTETNETIDEIKEETYVFKDPLINIECKNCFRFEGVDKITFLKVRLNEVCDYMLTFIDIPNHKLITRNYRFDKNRIRYVYE